MIDDEVMSRRWARLAEILEQETDGAVAEDEAGATLAAVLLLLYDKNGEPHVVFTKRTERVAAHKGEISLPGGAFEKDKDLSLLQTALREAAEEVGLEDIDLRVLGRLPKIYTMSSNYAVVPFVATTPRGLHFHADPFEVAEVLEVPLASLRDPEAIQEEDREYDGEVQRTSYYAYGEHKIWGATARILNEFFAVLEAAEA